MDILGPNLPLNVLSYTLVHEHQVHLFVFSEIYIKIQLYT